jgi:hypothetical protein
MRHQTAHLIPSSTQPLANLGKRKSLATQQESVFPACPQVFLVSRHAQSSGGAWYGLDGPNWLR